MVETMIDSERYLILVGGGPPSNYSAWSPEVLGCVAVGDTVEECIAEMRSALAAHLELMHEDGEALPEPYGPGVYIERTAAAV
jgi:predicted RNase H-like HicB family nuclease